MVLGDVKDSLQLMSTFKHPHLLCEASQKEIKKLANYCLRKCFEASKTGHNLGRFKKVKPKKMEGGP